LADTIGGRISENDTLKGAIRDNAKPIIDLLMDSGVLRADNREQYFNKEGVTPEGIDAAYNVVRQLLFEGAGNDLSGKFDSLPFFQREAIEKTIPAILSNRELKTNMQSVIEILHDKTTSDTPNFNTWAKQYDMFKAGKAPVDVYKRANLALAKKIDESKNQKEISTIIKELAALMNGAPQTLFDDAKEGLPFEESVAEKNILFATEQTTSEEVDDMVDIIKDLVDEGTLRLKQIQDYVAKELEDDSPELRELVATAYHEYGKLYTPNEITQGIIGRIGGFLSKIFGGKGAERIFISINEESLLKKANELGDVEYHVKTYTVGANPAGEVVVKFYETPGKHFNKLGKITYTEKFSTLEEAYKAAEKQGAINLYEYQNGKILPPTGRSAGLSGRAASTVSDKEQIYKGQKAKKIDTEIVNGFYSPLEKAINEINADRLPAKQWADKFKGEEAKWTGLTDWLNSQSGSISKAEIRKFLKDNRIEIVEVVKGDSGENQKSASEQMEDIKVQFRVAGYKIGFEMGGDVEVTDTQDRIMLHEPTKEDLEEEGFTDYALLPDHLKVLAEKFYELNEQGDEYDENAAKYSGYQLAGDKSNYKEVLVTLPARKIEGEPYAVMRDKYLKPALKKVGLSEITYENALRRMKNYADQGRSEEFKNDADYPKAQEAIRKLNENGFDDVLEKYHSGFSYNAQIENQRKATFRSSHFTEPNILVHLRMNTRVDEQGKKVLFLEEVQSDYGELGRKQGFKKLGDTELQELKSKLAEAEKEYNKLDFKNLKLSEIWETPEAKLVESLKEQISENEKALPAAPFVTDTNAWTKLGLKVALKEAVKQGADKIAWTTGEQQADRYDLSKQVDRIIISKPHEDGISRGYYHRLHIVDKNGQRLQLAVNKDGKVIEGTSNLFGKNLKDVVGKEMAEKIMAVKFGKLKEFSGLDLKIGGEGMEGFYGNPSKNKLGIVGNIAKSLFKQEPKTTNISVGKYDIGEANYVGGIGVYDLKGDLVKEFDTLKEAKDFINKNESSQQHSITITPELKSLVSTGQPLFQLSPEGKILGFTHEGTIYLNGKHLNPNTPIHEAGHIWMEWTKQNNPTVYDRGIELVIGSKYIDTAKNNKFYKQEAAKLPKEEREAYFQHEALAMAIGDKGAQFITQAKKSGFREWLNNLWERIKHAAGFTDITPQQLENLTFEQFAERAAADILRNEEVIEEEETEPRQNITKEAKDGLSAYKMTTGDATNKFLSGSTIESVFGEAPEGDQSYYVQKLSDMLQDGKNMIGIAQGAWGTDIADYGRKLFSAIRKMSMDQELSNKKAVLLATFLGEIKEEMIRNDRKTELTPLYNQVEGYYQGYMNIVGKSAAAGRLLRLYRDKYLGDVFANRILEEQQVREKEELRKAEEQSQMISDLVAAEVEKITAQQKEKDDKEADEQVKKEKAKSEKKGKLAKSDAQKMAAEKLEIIKNKGGLTSFVDKIKETISKLNCK
jgi:hypothetical protein